MKLKIEVEKLNSNFFNINRRDNLFITIDGIGFDLYSEAVKYTRVNLHILYLDLYYYNKKITEYSKKQKRQKKEFADEIRYTGDNSQKYFRSLQSKISLASIEIEKLFIKRKDVINQIKSFIK